MTNYENLSETELEQHIAEMNQELERRGLLINGEIAPELEHYIALWAQAGFLSEFRDIFIPNFLGHGKNAKIIKVTHNADQK